MKYFNDSEKESFKQFLEAEFDEDSKEKIDINDLKSLMMEYKEWKETRCLIDPVLLEMLVEDGYDIDSPHFAEIQKGAEDSIFNNPLVPTKNSKIITPYSKVGFKTELKDRIITCDDRLVYLSVKNNLPYINTEGEKPICLHNAIDTYMLANPYDAHYPKFEYGYLPLIHKTKTGDVILAVTGQVTDKDYEKKISMIESLLPVFKAFGENNGYINPYIVNSTTVKDGYYMYIATNPKEKELTHVRTK